MKRRRTLQSTPEFLERLRRLQGKIKATSGIEPSLTELTDKILKTPAFEEVERQVLSQGEENLLKFRVRFDRKLR